MQEFSSESLVTIAIVSACFTGLASVIAAIGAAISAVISAKNAKKIDAVHQATNGMKAELVKENGERMYAKGVLKGERSLPKSSSKGSSGKKNGRSPNRN